jgi:HlyD family secretion protein
MAEQTRPWLRRLLIAGVVVAALAALVWWLGRPKPVAVVLTEVGRGTVEATIANTRAGTVEACQRTKLSTIAGGRIEVLAVKEGDRVKKGQLLMQLWHADQQAEVRLAQAQLESARKRVVEACTLADSAVREAERRRDLFKQGFISESAYDAARVEADARSAACATARTDIAQAQARIDVARVAQGRTVLVAPFDGTVPRQSFPGKVKRVAPYVTAVEKQARTVDIEATFDDPASAGPLLVGYSADVEIILEVRKDALRVPTSALLEGGRVLVLADGKLAERKVKLGLANWEYTEIVDGLAAGDRIVTSLEREGVKAGAVAEAESAGKGK